MNTVYADALPEDQRPPVDGDWVAVAKPPRAGYLIAVPWGRGLPQPRGRELRPLIRDVRARVAHLVQGGDPPTMPFYFRVDGVWVGLAVPDAADWSPAIALNDTPA